MEKQDSNTFLTFRVGNELYAVNTQYVISIIEMKPLTRIPETPNYIEGVINFRGTALPVLNLHVILGSPKKAITPETAIVINELTFENSSLQVGMIVDSLTGVFNYNTAEILPAPEISQQQRKWIEGLVQNNETFTQILNLKALIDEASRQWIEKIGNNAVNS